MRIRKRQIPLPFSSLSPLTPSDPAHLLLLRRRPPVQLLRPTSPHAPPDSPPLEQHDADYDTKRDMKVFGAQTSNEVLDPKSTSSPQVMGDWCEREKTFPLKKRRGSFKKQSNDNQNNNNEQQEDQITTITTVKATMANNKSTLPQQEEEEGQSKPPGNNKKKSRGGPLMEGSRCSRVNGRGWRCCQQTLVGYSLCEHHLGKGRLRSMNSVRNRSLAATATKSVVVVEKDDEKKPSLSPPSPVTSKKRMKLGVVKARSMSSLLGQPDGVIAPPPPLPPT